MSGLSNSNFARLRLGVSTLAGPGVVTRLEPSASRSVETQTRGGACREVVHLRCCCTATVPTAAAQVRSVEDKHFKAVIEEGISGIVRLCTCT